MHATMRLAIAGARRALSTGGRPPLSAERAAQLEERMLSAVRRVREPISDVSLGEWGLIKRVSVTADATNVAIELPTAAYPERANLKIRVEQAVQSVPELASTQTHVSLTAGSPQPGRRGASSLLRKRAEITTDGLSRVGAIVAVSS